MQRFVLLLLLVLWAVRLCAQQPFQYVHALAGSHVYANDLKSLPGNSVLVGGHLVQVATGKTTCFLARSGASGAIVWARSWETTLNDIVTGIAPGGDGGGIAVYSAPTQTGSRGGIRRLDAAGQTLWNRQTSGHAVFRNAHALLNGDVVAAGYALAPNGNDEAAAVYRVDASGQTVWRSAFTESSALFELRDVWEDEQGFLYAVGYTLRTGIPADGVVCRFTPAGTLDWVKRFEAPGENRFLRIVPLGNGATFVVGGYAVTAQGNLGACLAELRADGTVVWAQTYALQGNNIGLGDMAPVQGGAYFTITGIGSGTAQPALCRINTSGQLLEVNEYTPSGFQGDLAHLAPTVGDGFYWTDGVSNGADRQLLVVRTDANGNVPPCCPKSANLRVDPVAFQVVNPPVQTFQPSSLQAANALAEILLFEAPFDACPAVNTEFTLSDTAVCPGECVDLMWTNPAPGAVYAWLTPGGELNAQNPMQVCYASEGMFPVIPLINGCAQNTAAQTVAVSGSEDAIPNAFTPDGDGTNDLFRPLLACPVSAYTLDIYSRWGQKVYSASSPDDAWDGRQDGVPAPSDTYVWVLRYTTVQGVFSERKGQVTLLR